MIQGELCKPERIRMMRWLWPVTAVFLSLRTLTMTLSETQLRSRLKKWRVTKPSRQTRKKSQYDQQDVCNGTGPAASRPRKADKRDQSIADQGWCIVNGMYSPQDHHLPVTAPFKEQNLSRLWIPPIARQQRQQQSLSPQDEDSDGYHSPPSVQQFSSSLPNSNLFNQLHPSPVTEGAVMSNNVTPVMTPNFPSTTYPLSPVSRLQSPLPTTIPTYPAQWPGASDQGSIATSPSLGPVPQWYSVTSDGIDHQPLSIPFYAISPVQPSMAGGYEDYVQPMPPQTPGSLYSPPSPQYTNLWREDSGDVKPWKEANPTGYDSEPEHFGVNRQGRLRVHGD